MDVGTSARRDREPNGGDVRARKRHGADRAVARGTAIYPGDQISTQDGRLQIRFSDGGYVSLLPNTDFVVRAYSYDGRLDGEETSFFGLTRGAMRAVTGWIGRINKSRYTITTPTATIGVRGTGGLIEVGADGTLVPRRFRCLRCFQFFITTSAPSPICSA